MALKSNKPSANYYLIINRITNNGDIAKIAEEFAQAFMLDTGPAEQIVRSAPIVFLSGLDTKSIDSMQDKLVSLSKFGVEFLITVNDSSTLPSVDWTDKQPDYTQSISGELACSVDLQGRENVFVCPNCSETYVFSRIGKPSEKQPEAKTEGNINEANIKPAEILEVEKKKAEEEIELVADSEQELLNLPSYQELDVQADDTEEGSVIELKPIIDPSEEKNVNVKPLDILEDLGDTPKENIDSEKDDHIEKSEPEPEPINLLGRNELDIEVPSKVNYNLFLTSIPDDKKMMATELLARIKKIPLKEAHDLSNRLLVPVLKDVNEEKANKCLKEFQKLGIQGKIIIRR